MKGLFKKIEIGDTGQFAEFHKVFVIQINAALNHLSLKVETQGFVDEDVFDRGKGPTNMRIKAETRGAEAFNEWADFPIPEGAKTLKDVLFPASYAFSKANAEKLIDAVEV